MNEKPTFLLVHGSWHGSWVWDFLRPALLRHGYVSEVVDLPSCGPTAACLGGLPEDAAVVAAATQAIPGRVIVVGHSYGGPVLCEAQLGPNVSRLVFLSASMPDTGRLYMSYWPSGPAPTFVGLRDDGTTSVPPGEAVDAFYLDCSPETAAWAQERLVLQSQSVTSHPITRASWREIPSTYIVLEDDRAIPVPIQEVFAVQANEVFRFESSHSPMLSRPDDLAKLLVSIAERSEAPSSQSGRVFNKTG